MVSKMFVFLLVLSIVKFASSFYYSNGLCPKLKTIDYSKMPSVLMNEAYRFAEKPLEGYFDQGTCTLYAFLDKNITISTYRSCRFINKKEFYNVSRQEIGDGYKMTKTEPDQIKTEWKYFDDDYCKINEYLGNDNVSDTNILKLIEEDIIVAVLWGCDQINENLNKQKLIILTTNSNPRDFNFADSLISDLKNEIISNETVTEYKIEQTSIICGTIQNAMRSSQDSLVNNLIISMAVAVFTIFAIFL